jgi:hypothetical protein
VLARRLRRLVVPLSKSAQQLMLKVSSLLRTGSAA